MTRQNETKSHACALLLFVILVPYRLTLRKILGTTLGFDKSLARLRISFFPII